MLLHILLLLLLLTTAHGVEAEVIVTMTPGALGHVFRKEMSSLHESIIHLRPPPFKGTYLGLEVTVDHLQVVDLKMPRLSYESTPSQLTFKMLGGSARLLGQYSAVYKTKREGQFEMLLEHFHVSLPVQRSGATKFSPTACSLQLDESLISLSPVLPEQIAAKIKAEFLAQLEEAVCQRANGFFDKLNGKLAHFAEAMDISQGNHPSHIDVELDLQNQKISDEEHHNAVHVAITESVINAELGKLYNTANTRLIWNDVPEIKDLLKSCESPECRAIEDGDITSSLFDKPSIRIQEDNTISLKLPLSTTLSAGRKELFSIKTEAQLMLEDVVIESPEDGFVSWSAKFKVKSIKVMQTSSSRAFQKFASTMENWVNDNKEFIENLLSSYLHGSLPVHLRSPLSWSHRLHAAPDFATSSLKFHVHPHFSPALRVNV